jgi:hypothetical protein
MIVALFNPCPKPIKKQKIKPKYGKISPVSPKRAKENKLYKPLADQFKLDHPVCEIQHTGCTQRTTEVHHTKGRKGKLYLDPLFWKGSCNSCHRWATDNSKAAKETGASASINHRL